MPIIILNLLRPLIIWIAQAGLTYVGFLILEKLSDKLLEMIKDHYELEDDDARILLANNIIDIFLVVGVGSGVLASKIPVSLAKKLGFANAKVAKRALSSKGAAKIKVKDAVASGDKLAKGLKTISILGALGVGNQMYSNFINTFDFATWESSAYQNTFQKIFSFFGLEPDQRAIKSNVLSDEMWNKVYNVYKNLGAVGINDPDGTVSLPFTKANLVKVVDKVAAQIVGGGGKPTLQNVIASTQGFLIMNGLVTDAKVSNAFPKAVASAVAQPKAETTTQQIKVFTGVVSQGALGQGLSFQERQDDLIENIDELKQASSNNLAPFLVSLPSRVRYEIKVVSSITTKDGFTQKGTAQQVKVGTYQNGNPKYKTVVNKFAVMDLFILTDRGTRTKLTTIVLGPTNAITFSPGINDLNSLAQELPKLITTQNTNDVSNIITNNDNVISETTTPTTPVYGNVEDEKNDTGFRFYKFSVNGETYYELLPWLGNVPFGATPITKQEYLDQELLLTTSNPTRWKPYFDQIRKSNPTVFTTGISGYIIKDGVPYYVGNGSLNDTVNSVTSANSVSVKTGANALTLSEWYQSKGQALPSVSTRSVEYERLGLGSKNYYTGTSEQNTKLLNALKLS